MPLVHQIRLDNSNRVPYGAAATRTKAFPANIVRDFGPASDATPMKITIALQPRNEAKFDAIIKAQNTPGNPMYHRFFTANQTKALFSPSAAQVRAVASYLSREGFGRLSVTDDNQFVIAHGTVRSMNAAFGTMEHHALYKGRAVLVNTRDAVVPAELAATIKSVVGAHTVPMHGNVIARTKTKAAVLPNGASCVSLTSTGDCYLNDFTPRAFWVAYDAGGNLPGTDGSGTADYHSGINTPIAIIAEGILSGVVSDLRIQENDYSLPPTSYRIVNETGNPTQTDTSGADEFDLDTQTSTGVAGNVKRLDIYDAASLEDSDLIVVFDQFVTDDVAKAASASFGGCTSLEALSGGLTTYDAIFAEAMMQGQTVFASSGDTGAACEGIENGVPDAGVPGTEYPASSEYVVGVGGTSLLTTPSNLYQGETAWATGGGGGIEPFESEGSWATSLTTAYTAAGTRAVPDISMDADPNISGADVTVAGATEIIGGTSLASPMALAVWARIESNNGESLGSAAPYFYKEFGDAYTGMQLNRAGDFTETVNGFNDILLGTDGFYPATAGYDLASGLGSLDIALQIQDIKN